MNDLNIDSILSSLHDAKLLPETTLCNLLLKGMEILIKESNVLEIPSPVFIVGDIHAQLFDLLSMFDKTAPNGIQNQKYLFLGDYVDRGKYSIATFAYVIALKIKYPNQIFLLRGSHECRRVNQTYGLYNDCLNLYGHSGVWNLFNTVFDSLPVAALIDNDYFAVHGGLSPNAPLIESLSVMYRYQEIPARGPLADILWSDPEKVEQWHENQRGFGFFFGKRQVDEFCRNNGLEMIIRSHQLSPEGYKWYFDNKLCSIWSAPNYMDKFGNKACVMNLEGGEVRFEFFESYSKD
jgi:diadenosine tetraphosphatase ApaH/serine/threonine PP2A family protein phosphatase